MLRMRLTRIAALILLTLAAARGAEPDRFQADVRPLVEQFCFPCHSGPKPKGDIDLEPFRDEVSIQLQAPRWILVLGEVSDRHMPPKEKPQPSQPEREKIIDGLKAVLGQIDESRLPKDPGRVILRRLSRLEYNLTVRDLLGVTSRPADRFPPDGGGGGGFDNNADTLFVPPVLIERLIEAAALALKEAPTERIFTARPSADLAPREAARRILDGFAPRAWRRPVAREEIDRWLGLFDEASARENFDDAVRTTLQGLLVSPRFLFRVEEPCSGSEPCPVGDFELASRLSYFIWSSMPDGELLDLAREGKLGQPDVLSAQVRRMVRDPRSRALAESFAAQWLGIGILRAGGGPDPRRFAEYTPSLRDAMLAEPVEVFDHVLREDRSLLDLLDGSYTFVNDELSRHYELPAVEGKDLRRVDLPDRRRGGVLGMGAVLTLTSYPLRTSPVLRGKWVLEEILGTPPPPPPPMVGVLPQDDAPRDGLTFRQRLEAHRSKPQCASCHARLDPPGFGLENFDPIGRWRTAIRDKPVDASGVLPTGEKFDGPVELKRLLLARKDDFTRNLAEKMLAYALGRGLEYYDQAAVRHIVRGVAAAEYRTGALIEEIVKSYPFRYKRGRPPEEGQAEERPTEEPQAEKRQAEKKQAEKQLESQP